MDILWYLVENFLKEEWLNTSYLVIISLTLTFLQTNVISYITASIIESIHSKNISNIITNYYYFIFVTIMFFVMLFGYKYIQNNILHKLTQWIRNELFKIILKTNNENISNINFTEFFTPLTRMSNQFYMMFSNIISIVIPTIAFLIIISLYFLYKSPILGIGFTLGNIIVFGYIFYFWQQLIDAKQKHENVLSKNDKYIIDTLNNIDKVIYRGQIMNEIKNYTSINNTCIDASTEYANFITKHVLVLSIIINIIVFVSIGYLIHLYSIKKLDTVSIVTFLTILLLYRDRIYSTTSDLNEYVDFKGRLDHMSKKFDTMISENMLHKMHKKYETQILLFDQIIFQNVYFKYPGTDRMILNDLNLNINVDNQVIGVVGLSGTGKSSFIKLILRLYDCTKGTIFIDGVDITTIDPTYIRDNITYINQTSKLFDRKVIENILYGCKNLDSCNSSLKEILQYPKIQELFKNVDIHESSSGSLGENLSGGQRQIISIISGLINPSKILILDEPTNALDPELKRQLLTILSKFKKYKKSIIIITHDKDVTALFDQTIQL
jgi:ABC-type multidrug transport system fused ATPase/permease subunit